MADIQRCATLGPVPTLAQLRRTPFPRMRVRCRNPDCRHTVPLALVSLMIRWSPDTSSLGCASAPAVKSAGLRVQTYKRRVGAERNWDSRHFRAALVDPPAGFHSRGLAATSSAMPKPLGDIERRKKLARLPHVVEIIIPPAGLGEALTAMHAWSLRRCGPAGYMDSARTDREQHDSVEFVVFHFPSAEIMRDFAARFEKRGGN